jgi:hypothetical protein
MSLVNIRSLVEAERNGQTFFSTFRKQATQTTLTNIWFDLSMSPGNPAPNYYIGPSGVFTALKRSTDGGLPHRGILGSGYKQYLRTLEMQTATATAVPLNVMVLDYIGFYAFLDESITDEQLLDNTTPLPRYDDGLGVQMMPVVVAGQGGGGGYRVTYTNSDGVSGRMTPRHLISTTQFVNGTIISSAGSLADSRGPFLALQEGDKGVRSVQSVTFDFPDIGLMTLVLVKPLARHVIRGVDAPSERDFYQDFSAMPEIKDDAYLNLIALPPGTLSAAPIHGYIKTCWI